MHFYSEENGNIEPRHFVKMAKDPSRTRPSRVTDAKKAAKEGKVWYPSVTTVLNILDKPALLNWKVDKHLEQAINYTQIEDINEFKRVVKAATQEEMDKAPQAGTDIHNILEHGLFDSDFMEDKTDIERLIVDNVRKALQEHCSGCDWSTEAYFINKTHGYAGCADLVGQNWIIDYKSKQTADKFKPGKMAYPEHARQLASYGMAFCKEPVFRAANIFICLETGDIDFHEHSQEALHNGWLDFLDCLSIYKRNTYNPLEA